jgi:type III pantothenate kinase
MSDDNLWFALAIGNSRLHWAQFDRHQLTSVWDTPHLDDTSACETRDRIGLSPLWIASVVPTQLQLWQTLPNARTISLEHVPLRGLYPTLGIDRALVVWGAGCQFGFPILAIDAGTALTVTGANSDRELVGGAILPGVRLQLTALSARTAALPDVRSQPVALPKRWALDTQSAMYSGVVYGIAAAIGDFIEAWQQDFPASSVVLTGGDRDLLGTILRDRFPQIADRIHIEPNTIFWGIQLIVDS